MFETKAVKQTFRRDKSVSFMFQTKSSQKFEV